MTINYAIIENFVTTLKNIEQGVTVTDYNGAPYTYKHTPEEVDDDFEIWTNVREFPAFFVTEGNAEFQGSHQRRYKGESDVTITVYVKDKRADKTSLQKKLAECVLDAIVAIHQDTYRGRTCQGTFLVRVEKETRAVKPYGIAEIFLTVIEHFGV